MRMGLWQREERARPKKSDHTVLLDSLEDPAPVAPKSGYPPEGSYGGKVGKYLKNFGSVRMVRLLDNHKVQVGEYRENSGTTKENRNSDTRTLDLIVMPKIGVASHNEQNAGVNGIHQARNRSSGLRRSSDLRCSQASGMTSFGLSTQPHAAKPASNDSLSFESSPWLIEIWAIEETVETGDMGCSGRDASSGPQVDLQRLDAPKVPLSASRDRASCMYI
ncbi:hypothetical protein B0J17DRAFT_633255 [Rhizoctonia solani]|nr:hypothetical protein B0J17DRAFT_633255 [Rhizoctonia solani]